MLHGVGIWMQTVCKEERAAPVCSQAGQGTGMGRMRGAEMSQRMLEEPGRGGEGKEGFGWSAGLHNQPGGAGWVLRMSCSRRKKTTKSH